MHNAAQQLAISQAHRYASDLSAWSQRVTQARRPLDAFRLAANKPVPGHLARPLSSIWRSDLSRAEMRIERHLGALIADLSCEDPDWITLMRLAQGHWPRIHLEMTRRQRMRCAGSG